ncbi:leucine-rich repeat domain-containing protein [Aquimarina macrocephali]|uniref:leucine-rich repeat domain-containing protein n=1 Tax=Aquimarina macrocephali TaxID=666563 RepID=UPI0004BA8E27|nr:leucine-rich repeat domain-containing protein [Aquimarina macrocephali]
MKTVFKYIILLFLFVTKMYGHTSGDTSNNLYQISCEVSEIEKQALWDLYNTTDGPNWKNTKENNKPWDVNTPVCDWFGVTVSNGRVNSLNLAANELTRSIPKEIGNLTSLETLQLSHNKLTGSIPKEISNLTSLETLRLNHNELTGAIPKEIGSLISLDYLNLGANELTGSIPKKIDKLTSLGYLYLNDNNLTGSIPEEIGNLISLNVLNLQFNELTGSIPKEIGKLTSLVGLYLYNNKLTGSIPKEIDKLTSLDYLDLGANELTGPIPKEIGKLTSLDFLRLSYNKLTGSIPKEIGKLTSLETLHLPINELTGSIPKEIGNLTSLVGLYLYSNKLTGSIPKEIASIKTLDDLTFSSNNFVFSDFEKEHGVYEMKAYYLYLQQAKVDQVETKNVITGQSITLSTTSLTSPNNSYQWYKDGVAITGATNKNLIITNTTAADTGVYHFRATNSVIDKLTLERHPITLTVTGNDCGVSENEKQALWALYTATDGPNWKNSIENNKTWNLSTPVCDWYGVTVSNGKVVTVRLSNNNLAGHIPSEIEGISYLQNLTISGNENLSGEIPISIGKLINLKQLAIYGNPKLSGSIPKEIGNLTNLTRLTLNQNNLTGTLPVELGNLTKMSSMLIRSNQLTGAIPRELAQIDELWELFLDGNQLTGGLPPEIGRLSNLRHLSLSNNKLTGTIPVEYKGLIKLTYLALSNNELSGVIPSELFSLQLLEKVFLDRNNFEGSIPSGISELSNLERLIINNNHFKGKLPIINSLALEYLSIHYNEFVFSDIEEDHSSYKAKAQNKYRYSPQAKVDQPETKSINTGQSITLTTTALTSTNNSYQWYKDGVAITGATSKDFIISNAADTDAGVYHFRATNTVVNGLALERRPITLTITTEDTCGVSAAEKQALLDLYNATNGANWKNTIVNNKPWDANTPVCDWYGVTVANGNVIRLKLENNELKGLIPKSLQNLTKLNYFNLNKNKLTGSIPGELGKLSSLTHIQLKYNQLNGNIPIELTNLQNLIVLHLSNNQLRGYIPKELSYLKNLKQLVLEHNMLNGSIPKELSNLSNLEHLSLNSNQLSGVIPAEFSGLIKLRNLAIANNQFVFSDFEKEHLTYKKIESYLYSPQAKVDQPETKSVITGQSITLSTTALTSTNNRYQWYKTINGVTTAIPDATSKEYVISSATAADQGIYHFLATNSVITDLTLERHPITITIKNQNNCSSITCEEAVIQALNFLKENDIISFPQVEYTLTDNPAFFETCVDEVFNINNQDTLVWKNISASLGYALQLNGVSIFEVFRSAPGLSDLSIASFSSIDITNVHNAITYLGTDGSLKVMSTTGFLLNCTPKDCVDCPVDTNFCLSGVSEEYPLVEYLVPQGEHIVWYLTETGGTAIKKEEFITTEAEKPAGITYWWDDTSDAVNTRTPLIVKISDNVPVVEEFQSFSKGMQATIGDLKVEGDNVQWYTVPVGGTPLSTDTILENEKTYFAEGSGTPCRAPVIVSIGTLPPEGDGYQVVCEGTTLAELEQKLKIIEGSTIKWYDQQENGSELSATIQVENGVTYYASQVDIYGDISEFRKEIAVNVVIVSPPFVPETLQTFYNNKSHTIADLLAIGYEIRWYDRKIGGTVYADSEELIDGQVYYAEQRSENDCPGIRQGVQVRILEEETPELFGCEKFKPKAGDRYVVNGWVREQGINRVNPDVRLFNDSKESKMFVELLNHLKNRIIDTDPDIYYIPEIYIPQSATQNLDFDPLLAYVNDTQIEERKLTVYGLTLENDTYGHTIGFSFALNKNRTSTFTYLSPKVRRKDSGNGTSPTLTYRYPIRDNKDNMTLTFTDVRVENGQFYMISNFSMLNAGSDTVTLTNVKDSDSKESGINPEVTFYQDEEISGYQPITYLNTLVKITYKDADEGVMDTHGLQFKPQGLVIEGWQQVSGSFTIPVDAHQMTLSLENTSSEVNVYFDDIRFHPYDGNMKTFVYDPATQRLMSELDENNFATFYEYDAEGGLVRIKKETERGVFTIQESRSGNTKATK